MVHEDGSFTAAQKLYYLRTCISGATLDLIKSVPIKEANYDVAIDQLKNRYDNRSLIIQSSVLIRGLKWKEPNGHRERHQPTGK